MRLAFGENDFMTVEFLKEVEALTEVGFMCICYRNAAFSYADRSLLYIIDLIDRYDIAPVNPDEF